MGWNVAWSGKEQASVDKSLDLFPKEFPNDRYIAVKCKVSVENELTGLWDAAFNKFGRVDIWVNNAGLSNMQSPFHLLQTEEFISVIDTNIKGLMLATHIAYNRMLKQGFGAIYNMEGLGSDGRMIPGLTPYGTSKRAVRYFTDGFAKELYGGPVIVGTISPGMVLTDMILERIRRDPESNREFIKVLNILANDAETVTPFLVKRMTENKKNRAKISWLTGTKVMKRFLMMPFSRRDVVSRHLR